MPSYRGVAKGWLFLGEKVYSSVNGSAEVSKLRATLTPYILAEKYKPWHKSGADVTGVVWWRAVGR